MSCYETWSHNNADISKTKRVRDLGPVLGIVLMVAKNSYRGLATRRFCEAAQNCLVRAQTLPGFSDFFFAHNFSYITLFVLNLQT